MTAPRNCTPFVILHLEGERLRRLPHLPFGGVLEWFDCLRFIEVQHGVELVRQPRPKVMAQALGFGQVDDPDRPLEPGAAYALRMDKKFKALLPPPRWSSPLHGRALYGPARAGARRRRSVLGGTGGAMDTGVQHASGARHVCGTHVASKTPVTVKA